MPKAWIDFDQPRFPVWEYSRLLELAAASSQLDYASNDAICTTSLDPPSAYIFKTNRHSLNLGSQRLLHANATAFVDEVRERFGFDYDSAWYKCRGAIAALIGAYYPENGQDLGWSSIMPMRRPFQFRSAESPGIEVKSAGKPVYNRGVPVIKRGWDRMIRLGDKEGGYFDFPINGLVFADSAGSLPKDNQWRRPFVNRQVRAPHFHLPAAEEIYLETWLCRAVPGADDARLAEGHIPAVALEQYQQNELRVRTTPIINLMKLAQGDNTKLQLQMLAIEIDVATGGKILSVRHSTSPLSVLLLNATPVEHIAVCQILRKFI